MFDDAPDLHARVYLDSVPDQLETLAGLGALSEELLGHESCALTSSLDR